ncbi:MAG: hypothetical protein GX250_01745, partial [Clostridiales bacterium]|nr:hypothetical protein [Clostridiales bacterium]
MKKLLKKLMLSLLALLILVTAAACAPSTSTVPSPSATANPNTGDEVDGELIFAREEELQYATEFTLTH